MKTEKRRKRYLEHREEELAYNRKYLKERFIKYPWLKHLRYVKRRVNNHPHYIEYNIKNYLTKEDIKELWFRDKAWLLEKASIDRIKSDGDYTKENCRFIELNQNLRRKRVWRKQKIGKNWYPLSSPLLKTIHS